MKRLFDILASLCGLLVSFFLLVPVMFLVWWQDRNSPFYIAERVGLDGAPFQMVKLRSMVVEADRSGVDSTSTTDIRITSVGHFIRKYKLDELTQLWNVLKGDMSLVGPRPNVKRETDLYTMEELCLLEVKPGITDFASIVFSDEGEILKDLTDPDIAYHQLIRPGKSKLGLFYIENRGFLLDLQLVLLSLIAIVSRNAALKKLTIIMKQLGAPEDLIVIATRTTPLLPSPPPGAEQIVISRDGAII